MRNSAVVAAVGALAVGIVSIPAAPAHAADTITAADQAYFSYYGFDRARAKGYTGEGVTIAIIGPRNLKQLEQLLAGQLELPSPIRSVLNELAD